jgi:hypothetical protein
MDSPNMPSEKANMVTQQVKHALKAQVELNRVDHETTTQQVKYEQKVWLAAELKIKKLHQTTTEEAVAAVRRLVSRDLVAKLDNGDYWRCVFEEHTMRRIRKSQLPREERREFQDLLDQGLLWRDAVREYNKRHAPKYYQASLRASRALRRELPVL